MSTWLPTRPPVIAAGGVVAAQSVLAAQAGAGLLREGGNAVDAAVATAFALAATEPWMSGLGGGGYMLVWLAAERRFHAVEFGMIAPAGLDLADYPLGGTPAGDIVFGWPGVVEDRNLIGPLSVALPGMVDGVGLALESFGRKPLAEVMQGAISLAEAGLGVDWYATMYIALAAKGLNRFPASRDIWLPGGMPPTPGWDAPVRPLPLGNLARTLRHIAAGGRRSFYEGPLAEGMAADMQAAGGRLSAADLAGYRARTAEVLTAGLGRSTIATVGGLTAGPSFINCIAALDRLPRGEAPDAARYLAYADILQRVTGERLETMGAGDTGQAPACTSHISVIDRDGNMVSLTQTLVSLFGSKLVLPDSGVLMNNSIMTFDPRPSRPNSIAPGRRPLANMCPTLAVRDGAAQLALGAAGGRRIMPAVLQLADFVTGYGMSLGDAFDQPRLDSSGTDIVTVDPRLPADVRGSLAGRFSTLEMPRMLYPLTFACPSAVWQGPDGLRHGMAEAMNPWAGAAAG